MNECAIKQRGRQWAAVFVTKLPVLLNDGHILRLIIDKVHRVQLYKTILTVVNSPRWLTVLASCKGQVDFSDHSITFFMNWCLILQNLKMWLNFGPDTDIADMSADLAYSLICLFCHQLLPLCSEKRVHTLIQKYNTMFPFSFTNRATQINSQSLEDA